MLPSILPHRASRSRKEILFIKKLKNPPTETRKQKIPHIVVVVVVVVVVDNQKEARKQESPREQKEIFSFFSFSFSISRHG
jgi:hypothetical protein